MKEHDKAPSDTPEKWTKEASLEDIRKHPGKARISIAVLCTALIVSIFSNGFLYWKAQAQINKMAQAPVPPKALSHLPISASALGHFDSGIPGMVGWKAQANGQKSIVYSTRDGKFMFLGVVMDKNGNNMTAEAYKKQFPESVSNAPMKADHSPAALTAQLALLKGGMFEGLTIKGSQPGDLWIAVDLHCPYCHQLVSSITKLLPALQKHVSIHYVPVAILGAHSAVAKSYLEMQPKKARLSDLVSWMQGKKGNNAAAAFPASDKKTVAAKAKQAVQSAIALEKAGFTAVPGLYLENKDGGINFYQGVPPKAKLLALLKG